MFYRHSSRHVIKNRLIPSTSIVFTSQYCMLRAVKIYEPITDCSIVGALGVRRRFKHFLVIASRGHQFQHILILISIQKNWHFLCATFLTTLFNFSAIFLYRIIPNTSPTPSVTFSEILTGLCRERKNIFPKIPLSYFKIFQFNSVFQ